MLIYDRNFPRNSDNLTRTIIACDIVYDFITISKTSKHETFSQLLLYDNVQYLKYNTRAMQVKLPFSSTTSQPHHLFPTPSHALHNIHAPLEHPSSSLATHTAFPCSSGDLSKNFLSSVSTEKMLPLVLL